MTITDEMVDKFEPVFLAKGLRAALEAVAPMLIAQGMREAEKIIKDLDSAQEAECFGMLAALRLRAQELDPND